MLCKFNIYILKASGYGTSDSVIALISNATNVNLQDNSGKTALFYGYKKFNF